MNLDRFKFSSQGISSAYSSYWIALPMNRTRAIVPIRIAEAFRYLFAFI